MDLYGIEEGAYACTVEPNLAYNASFGDLKNGGLAGLRDFSNDKVLLLFSPPLLLSIPHCCKIICS
jgi:hypothetical protein